MSTHRNKEPHPRAGVSGRISAEEYRTLLGRRATRGRMVAPAGRTVVVSEQEAALSDLPLRFTLPFVPPSVNNIFLTVRDGNTGRIRRVLTTKARRTRKMIAEFVRGRLSSQGIYEFHVTIEMPVLTKAGTLRKLDVSNRIKFLEDCVAGCLGIDDRQFFRVVLNKLHANHERTVVLVREYQHEDRDAA